MSGTLMTKYKSYSERDLNLKHKPDPSSKMLVPKMAVEIIFASKLLRAARTGTAGLGSK